MDKLREQLIADFKAIYWAASRERPIVEELANAAMKRLTASPAGASKGSARKETRNPSPN